ncbi:MAG TPA: cation diffusion facilitator family transporter [Anaerolineales bacterium]|jgi:cobalt-zinc-cadmium efflux system protein|nr:cation diffusion facilitator family transporter [Anaerolineales bacterium]
MEQHSSHIHVHLREAAKQTTWRLSLSLFLTLAFVAIEAGAGIFANSLALLTDAAHNLTDVIALGLTWFAVRITSQPANAQRTYGYHRAGILVALLNSTTLVLISLGIFYEAYHRFVKPPEVESGILIGVGLIAVVINLGTALLVHRGSEHDLNLRSAFVHLMGDVLSTVGAVIAGVIIYFTNANWLDPLVSVLIGFLILYNAWGILRDAVDILLESTPRDVNIPAMVKDIAQVDGVLGIHDIHVWSLTQSLRTMSAHILTDDVHISAGAEIQRQINEVLAHRYNITHATLQLECVDCFPDSLYCDLNGHAHVHDVPHPTQTGH